MAWGPRSRAHAHEFDVFEDQTAGLNQDQEASVNATGALGRNPYAVLEDREANGESAPEFIETLTAKLKQLHIYSPVKGRADRSAQSVQRLLNRSSTDSENFASLDPVREEAESCGNDAAAATLAQGPLLAEPPRVTDQDEGLPSSAETHASTAATTRQAPDSFEASFSSEVLRAANLEHHPLNSDHRVQSSIARHKAGQYDYVLSVRGPGGATTRKDPRHTQGNSTLNFGCNVLAQIEFSEEVISCQAKPANAFTILATPLGKEEVRDISQFPVEEENMAVAEPVVRLVSPAPVGSEATLGKNSQSDISVTIVERAHAKGPSIEVIENAKDRVSSISTDEESVQTPRTPPRSTRAGSQPRIEDSVEALDRLEEQLEAVDILLTPSKSRRTPSKTDESSNTETTIIRRTGSVKRGQSASVGAKPINAQARSPLGKSTTSGDKDAEKDDEGTPSKVPPRRTVPRPSSLVPPKPPARSTKPLTRPSFELPGEAVARRIKEQREARLAQQAQEKAAAVVPQRTRSLKAPTRPNFELPGEAISRRKREEREARLKAQAEEERKRREFKARPIRANLASAAYPRETVASRARQSRGAESIEATQSESPSKRSSILGTPRTPLTRSASTKSPQARGRGTSQSTSSPQVSRATSTSTGSMSGQRSTLSAEELEQQRIKGREVFERDNCYLEDKERERRERELTAKIAREQAAERSRQASREWAEKQRRRQLTASNAVARQAV